MKRALVAAAAAVVLAANAWVVAWALWNRVDASGGTVELTERELRLRPVSGDSTAVFLGLSWEIDSNEPDDDGAPTWLNEAKLRELGFDCRVPAADPHARDHYRSVPPALLYMVLEFDGEAAKKPGRSKSSRLVLVDMGREARQLRARYPDTARHLICHGVVRPYLKERSRREGRPLAQPRLSARVDGLLPQMVFVPPSHGRVLQGLARRPDFPREQGATNPPPRYAATVSWGRRYEPWVRSVRLLPAASQSK